MLYLIRKVNPGRQFMAGYQTDRLEKYPAGFQRVAQGLFDRLREIRPAQRKRFPGSYSIFGSSSKETAAKIVIYHPLIGKKPRQWPCVRDGVYILVRANGGLAENIWKDILDKELPDAFSRMSRTDTVAISPKHDERFAYFPLMAGDDLDEITSLLVACSRA
jgi:hypothetical protein